MMLEPSGLCPFYNSCGTRDDHKRIENVLRQERRDTFSEISYLERVEYNAAMREYENKFASLNRIEERCTKNHKRCLRFWQKWNNGGKERSVEQPLYNLTRDMITG
jgi:hypothetical protein